MKRWTAAIALACITLTPSAGAHAQEADSEPTFGDGLEGRVGGDGTVRAELTRSVPGEEGEPGVEAAGPASEAPEGAWVRRWDIIFVYDPPCVDTWSEFVPGATNEEATRLQQHYAKMFIAEFEAYISAGPAPPVCPDPDGTPAIDPAPAAEFADSAEAILPTAAPTISGGEAITGLRSWLDLGRDTTFTTTRELDLGGTTYTATFTATATATVDWGDGTVTTHTSRGGPYHDGEPGPDDITHTYTHAATSNTLTVVDTWDITVSVPVLDDITLVYEADRETITFPIREVRSARDS